MSSWKRNDAKHRLQSNGNIWMEPSPRSTKQSNETDQRKEVTKSARPKEKDQIADRYYINPLNATRQNPMHNGMSLVTPRPHIHYSPMNAESATLLSKQHHKRADSEATPRNNRYPNQHAQNKNHFPQLQQTISDHDYRNVTDNERHENVHNHENFHNHGNNDRRYANSEYDAKKPSTNRAYTPYTSNGSVSYRGNVDMTQYHHQTIAHSARGGPSMQSFGYNPQENIYRPHNSLTHRGIHTQGKAHLNHNGMYSNAPTYRDHRCGWSTTTPPRILQGKRSLPKTKSKKKNKKGAPVPFILSNICSTCGHAFLAPKNEAFFGAEDYMRLAQFGTPSYPLSSPGVNGMVYLTPSGFVQQAKTVSSQRATHFIALRLSNRDLLRNVSKFQEYIVGDSPKLIGTKMSLKKLHLSLLVVSLAGGLIPQAISAMKRAVALFTSARSGSIHKDARAQDVKILQNIIQLEREHLKIEHEEQLKNLNYYPLKLTFDRVASFGTSVLISTLPPHQVALITNFHEILSLCFAAVGIPIVGPGSHLNGIMASVPEPLQDMTTISKQHEARTMSKDFLVLQNNGPNAGSLAAATYYALAGTDKIPKFVLCGVCESKSARKTYREFTPSMSYWNKLLGKLVGLDAEATSCNSQIRSIAYSAVSENLLAQSLADQPIGLECLLKNADADKLGYASRDMASDLMNVPTSALHLIESEERSRSTPKDIVEDTSSIHNEEGSVESDDDMFNDEDSLLFSESDEGMPDNNIASSRKQEVGPDASASPDTEYTEDDIDCLYDISKLGMYFFPQVTLLKTSQAGRRTKTAKARRQMRHLRLHPSDYHESVRRIRAELLPSSAPMEADLYGVHLPFGEEIAISVELLEMSRSDEDGYYKRIGISPLINGFGSMLEEQFNAYEHEAIPEPELDTDKCPCESEDVSTDASSLCSSSLEEGEIRDGTINATDPIQKPSIVPRLHLESLRSDTQVSTGLGAFGRNISMPPLTPSTLSKNSTSLLVKRSSITARKTTLESSRVAVEDPLTVGNTAVTIKRPILHHYWETKPTPPPKRILHTYWSGKWWSLKSERPETLEPLTAEQITMNRMLETPWGAMVKGIAGWEPRLEQYETGEGSEGRVNALNSLVSPLDVLMCSARNYFDRSPPLKLTNIIDK